MGLQAKSPPTMKCKTYELAVGDLVVVEGGFWEIVGLEVTAPSSSFDTAFVQVTLRNEDKEQKISDHSCAGLNPTVDKFDPGILWWRTVNLS